MDCIESRIRVRYAETDQMGVAYYANYLVWMEVGRVEYCRGIGFEYREMEADGAILAVTEVNCRYRASARFDDEVRILTRMTEARSRTLRFAYEMRRAVDDQLLAQGFTLHTVCDPDGKVIRLPQKYRAFFPVSMD